ncbi:MAG TPA: hypothetical protein VFF17_07365 [Thermoanaerobaculia bacterium]|nr:hypothetical protein [Thermoanaerobaculia bacterium]
MTTLHYWSIAAALISAATPWFVVRVALAVARNHAPFPSPPSVSRLCALTIVACVATTAAAFLLPPPSVVVAAIDLVCFAGLATLGLLALGDISEASRPAREIAAATRTASLRPRRLKDYVPLVWRLVPLTIASTGLALLAWRLSSPGPDRRLLVPVTLVLAAPVFLWLYEVWMREEVSGGAVEEVPARATSRIRQVRLIFAAELIIVLCLNLAGHALLDLDWSAPRPWAGFVLAASAAIGITGCALAVSSDLARRRYSPHDAR